jgi:hypothetical protein
MEKSNTKHIKNSLFIDLDSSRDDAIRITKPKNKEKEVDNKESAKKMVFEDIITLCSVLGMYIQLANDSGYFDSKASTNMCINYLTENFLEKK